MSTETETVSQQVSLTCFYFTTLVCFCEDYIMIEEISITKLCQPT